MNSYLILDENLCFLNCTKGGKEPNPSIRDVPISVALQSAGFDSESWRELYPPGSSYERLFLVILVCDYVSL